MLTEYIVSRIVIFSNFGSARFGVNKWFSTSEPFKFSYLYSDVLP